MLPQEEAFVSAEEESAVAPQGAAQRAAELVAPQRRLFELRIGKEVSGIERVVADELPYAPMQLVGPAFGIDLDVGAAATAEFGGVSVGLDLEFLDRINNRAQRKVVERRIVVINAVENVVIRRGSGAGGAEVSSAHRDHARHELGEGFEAPPIERQLDHFLMIDHIADRRGL